MLNFNLKDVLGFHRSAWISGGVALACAVLLRLSWGELPSTALIGLVVVLGGASAATLRVVINELIRILATKVRHKEIRRRISLLDEREKQALLVFEPGPVWYDDYDPSWKQTEAHLVNLGLLERGRLGAHVPPEVQTVIQQMLCEQEEARRALPDTTE